MQVIVRGHAAAGYHNDILQAISRKLEPAGFKVHSWRLPFANHLRQLLNMCHTTSNDRACTVSDITTSDQNMQTLKKTGRHCCAICNQLCELLLM
jgi:recombinational DNA repair ATPase RecF